jgi:hypothetical protein
MNLRSRNTAALRQDEPIVRLVDFPPYARLAAIRVALLAARDARARQVDIQRARNLIAAAGRPQHRVIERLERLLAAESAAGPAQKAASADADGLPPSVAAALRLAAGESPEREPKADETLKRLRDEIEILDDGLRRIDLSMDEVRAEQSRVIAESLRDRHREILRSVYHAAAALAAADEAERLFFAQTILGGYEPRPDILQRPALASAARLGSHSEHDYEISHFYRRLERMGII